MHPVEDIELSRGQNVPPIEGIELPRAIEFNASWNNNFMCFDNPEGMQLSLLPQKSNVFVCRTSPSGSKGHGFRDA